MKKVSNLISIFASRILLGIIKFYQKIISPALPARCRYYPTCSEYGLTAIKWHGASRGGILTFKRICRCHPLGGHGIDFVPLPLHQYTYRPLNNFYYNGKVSRETIIVERGVYKDYSSYISRLNHNL